MLLLLLAASSYADDWRDGEDAFARGDYEAALASFETARAAGAEGPAVHYNIAVTQYKLGRYPDAADTFRLIAERFPQMRGLAQYNLGLIAEREGDPIAATEHYLSAYRLSQDDRTLRVLASNRLRELEPDLRVAAPWGGAIGVRAGYDDNVALRDTTGLPVGTTTDSPMIDVFASVSGPYRAGDGFRFEGSIYGVRNLDADEYDQNELLVAAAYRWRFDQWRLRLGTQFGIGTLGGDDFDRKAGVFARATRMLSGDASVAFSYAYDDVNEGEDQFAGIAGSRQQIGGRYNWNPNDGRRLTVRFRHERNDRLDPSVSSDRTMVSASYRFRPDSGWGYEVGGSLRSSRFDDLSTARTEDLSAVKLAFTRDVGEDWLLLLELQFSNNDSNDPAFSYDRSLLTFGAMRIF